MFSKLAKANLNHYNNHPVAHNTITVVYGTLAGVAIGLVARAMSKNVNPF